MPKNLEQDLAKEQMQEAFELSREFIQSCADKPAIIGMAAGAMLLTSIGKSAILDGAHHKPVKVDGHLDISDDDKSALFIEGLALLTLAMDTIEVGAVNERRSES